MWAGCPTSASSSCAALGPAAIMAMPSATTHARVNVNEAIRRRMRVGLIAPILSLLRRRDAARCHIPCERPIGFRLRNQLRVNECRGLYGFPGQPALTGGLSRSGSIGDGPTQPDAENCLQRRRWMADVRCKQAVALDGRLS